MPHEVAIDEGMTLLEAYIDGAAWHWGENIKAVVKLHEPKRFSDEEETRLKALVARA